MDIKSSQNFPINEWASMLAQLWTVAFWLDDQQCTDLSAQLKDFIVACAQRMAQLSFQVMENVEKEG